MSKENNQQSATKPMHTPAQLEAIEIADAMIAERDKQTAVQGDKNGHS